jgi:hypothetical protein
VAQSSSHNRIDYVYDFRNGKLAGNLHSRYGENKVPPPYPSGRIPYFLYPRDHSTWPREFFQTPLSISLDSISGQCLPRSVIARPIDKNILHKLDRPAPLHGVFSSTAAFLESSSSCYP